MQTSNRILDDLAKVANGAVATLAGVKDEVEAMIRQQVERYLADGNLVPRDEFDAMAEVAKPRTAAKKTAAKPAPRKAPAGKPKA